MSLDTSKTILKVVGIISVVLGGLGTAVGLFLTIAAFVAAANPQFGDANDMGITLVAGIIMLMISILPLILGIFALRGAKDSSKIIPIWGLAILSIVFGIIGLILNVVDFMGIKFIIIDVIDLVISIILFIAANTIKKNR